MLELPNPLKTVIIIVFHVLKKPEDILNILHRHGRNKKIQIRFLKVETIMSVIKSTLYLVTVRLDIAEVWVIELEDSNKNDPKIKYTGTKKRMEYL